MANGGNMAVIRRIVDRKQLAASILVDFQSPQVFMHALATTTRG